MTHLLDTSATLADLFGAPGEERVDDLINDENTVVGVSVLTLYETYTTVLHRMASHEDAASAVKNLREAVSEVIPVTEPILDLAFELRRASTVRIALADCLIAATAAQRGAILVHRDPHFIVLPAGKPAQEKLPDKQ